MKFAVAVSALLHLSLGQKPQLTQCLYNDGDECTVNTAMALSALGSPEAIEESFDKDIAENIEIVEQIMICGTYKSKERCPKDIGCIWVEGPTMGEEKCEIYARVVPEYLSCVEENPADWAFIHPAQIKARFADMEISKIGVRCALGKQFFDLCEVNPEDDKELAACPSVSYLIFMGLAEHEAFGFISESTQVCGARGANSQDCETPDKIEPGFVPAEVTALTITVTKVDDATPEEIVERLSVHFDLPLLQVFVGEENDAGEHDVRIISIAEGQTVAIYDILTNEEVDESNPLELAKLELVAGSVLSYVNVPIESAFDSEADISEFEGELPALTDIIGVEDLIPQTNLVIEDASELAARLMAIPQTVSLTGESPGEEEAEENSPPPEEEAVDGAEDPETAQLDNETGEDSSSADVDDPEDTDATADNAEPPAEDEGNSSALGLSQVGYAGYMVLLATALVQMAM